MSEQFFALGLGIGTKNRNNAWLEVYYPHPLLHPNAETVEAFTGSLGADTSNSVVELELSQLEALEAALRSADNSTQADIVGAMKASQQTLVAILLATDDKPSSVPEAYFKLQLLSHRLAKPHSVNLDGIFALLPNLAWTNQGPIELQELPQRQLEARLNGEQLAVNCVDKFPRMTDYVVPEGCLLYTSPSPRDRS